MRQFKIDKTRLVPRSEISQQYLIDISKYPILSVDQEIELATKSFNGDLEARNKLVQSNLRFVVSVARQYAVKISGIDVLDIINEGNIGLIEAANRFDPSRGFKFISYAVWWIRQAILVFLYNDMRSIRIPVNQIVKYRTIIECIDNFEKTYARPPSVAEISNLINMEIIEINTLINYFHKIESLDAELQSDFESTLLDLIPNTNIERTDASMLQESLVIDINRLLNKLLPREREVLINLYGLNGQEPLSLHNTAEKMNYSSERVRQIREEALRKLRKLPQGQKLISYL